MREKKELLILLLIAFLAFASPALAADNANELIDQIIPGFGEHLGDLKIELMASGVLGYDHNVNLNRYDEDGSMFMQDTLGVFGTYPIGDIFTLRGAYEFNSTKYFMWSHPDLVSNILSTGLDAQLLDSVLISVDYAADFVAFPHDEFQHYTSNEIATAIKHDINDWLYHKVDYSLTHKDYPKWATRNIWGFTIAEKREDDTNAFGHEVGMFIGDKTLVKATNRFIFNNSSELFLDYYNYRAYKTGGEVNHLITEKLYGSANFAYQYKEYDSRGVTHRNDEDQTDHTFFYGGSLFYDVTPKVSLGTTFDFTDNISNENDEKYEDMIVTGGVYVSF